MDLSAMIALGAAVLILLIGFRVYLLDRSNYQYRAFGALCVLLSWMCFCWYEMERTQDLATAVSWRRLQSVWALANPLIVYSTWRFSSLYLRPVTANGKSLFFLLILLPSLVFFTLEVLGTHTHGTVVPLGDGSWGLALDGLTPVDIARCIWTTLVYGSAIYFIYLVWREESIRFRKAWLFFLIVLLMAGGSLSILQNYILSPSGIVLPINESWNTLISVIFFGWALSDFQVFDLKPESAFENVADSMTNLMIVTNVNFQVKRISNSALNFFNADSVQVRNADLKKVIGEEAAGQLMTNLHSGIKQEINFGVGDRKASILFTTSMICNRRGRPIGYVFVGNDLTDYYRALEKVQHYNRQLEHSNKALEQFAFAVSHDLKEPLRTVQGFISLLQRHLNEQDATVREYLYHIAQGGERMNALIDSILTVSTLGHDNEKDDIVNLERILLEVNDKLRALCQQKNGLIRYDENLPAICGKHHQISLLFQNLIENGLKYNKHPRPEVVISGSLTGEGYVFTIRDNGIGIPLRFREQVFTMFKRLHSWQDYEGTGIGLNMCRQVVDQMGGRIWIESPNDGDCGTVFKFCLPREKVIIRSDLVSQQLHQYRSMHAGY